MSLSLCLCIWILLIHVFFIKTGAPCGYTVTDRRGEITSPDYPKKYADNLNCEWKFYVRESETITIQFLDFYIDYSYYNAWGCQDYLIIYDGRSEENEPILGRCGFQLPKPIVSSSNVVTIVFRTNFALSSRGFNFKWKVTDKFSLHTQSLSWLEAEEICKMDGTHLAIYSDGASPSLKKIINNIHDRLWIGQYEKGNLPESNICFSIGREENKTTVKQEESCQHELGFICQEEAITCGENITAFNGNISSPNYPESYSNDLFCVWEFSVLKAYTIVLEFLSVNIENSTDCLYDYIEIIDLLHNSSVALQRICGQTSNLTIVSSSNRVTIKFRSDAYNTSSGFLMEWHSGLIAMSTLMPTLPSETAHEISSPPQSTTNKTTREVSFPHKSITYTARLDIVTERSSKFKEGALAGIIVGSILFAIIVTCLVLITYTRYKRKKKGIQKETRYNVDACKENSKEEPTSNINLQDIYSKPVPKEFRRHQYSSEVDKKSSRPDSNYDYDTYNHLNEQPSCDNVSKDTQNVYGKLQAESDSYDKTKQSTVAMHSKTRDTYAYLQSVKDACNEQERNDSFSLSETQAQMSVMEPEYDNPGSEVSQSNAYQQNTYDHLSDLGKNIITESEYGFATTLKPAEAVANSNHNHEANVLKDCNGLDEDTYYNFSST